MRVAPIAPGVYTTDQIVGLGNRALQGGIVLLSIYRDGLDSGILVDKDFSGLFR